MKEERMNDAERHDVAMALEAMLHELEQIERRLHSVISFVRKVEMPEHHGECAS